MQSIKEAIKVAEETFKNLSSYSQPPKTYLFLPKGDLRQMPAYLPDLNVFGVKLVTVFPQNKLDPTVMSHTLLFDPDSGKIKSIIDSTDLTTLRTGAAGAVAAKYLCPKQDSLTVTVIGLGIQGFMLARCIEQVKDVKRFFAFDIDPYKQQRFAEEFKNAVISEKIQMACLLSDIIITATPSRTPVVWDDWVRSKDTLILAMGADAPGKRELAFDLLTRCNTQIICDSVEQAKHSGEINVGLKQIIGREIEARIFGDLTKAINEGISLDGLTIFDSTGIAALDIAFAAKFGGSDERSTI